MNGDNVIEFPGMTKVDYTPAYLMEKAREWDMEHCLIVGCTKEGELKFGGTTCDTAKILLLLERARIVLMADLTVEDTGDGR